jgi:hypothetical protein
MIAEHMARLDPELEAVPLDFEAAYKAHMARLGK